jgi:hypothetical protein
MKDMTNIGPTRVTALVFSLLLGGSMASSAGSTHYRWINDRGEPVFSDRPPPQGVDYEVISTQSSFKRVVPGEEGAVPLEVEPTVGNEFEQVSTAQAGRAKKNIVICEKARANLEVLENSDIVQVRDDQGELRDLSPEEMDIARETAKAKINIYCK